MAFAPLVDRLTGHSRMSLDGRLALALVHQVVPGWVTEAS